MKQMNSIPVWYSMVQQNGFYYSIIISFFYGDHTWTDGGMPRNARHIPPAIEQIFGENLSLALEILLLME